MTPEKKASQILEQRRKMDRENQQKRINEVYEKIPQIKSIDRQIKELGFSSLKLASFGKETQEYEKKIKDLSAYKKRLLRENGYSEDYMEIKYFHPACQDTGFVGNKVCSCRKQLIIDQKYDQSNIRDKIREENFASFDINLFSRNPDNNPISPYENMTHILKVVRKYCANFAYETSNIYIYGEVGRGKTFLLNSIAKEILDQNFSVLYVTAPRLFKFLNDYLYAFEDRREKLDEKYRLIFESDLLIIDDLGAEASRPKDPSLLFDLVNERMNEGKPIIFSSNLDLASLQEEYGDRIFSRIMGNETKILEIYGRDLRL